MAYTGYGAKYNLPFSDIYYNGTEQQYIATIYKKGYTGDLIDVSATSSPLIIETDSSGDSGYRPFIASKASLNLLIGDSDLSSNWDDQTSDWDIYAAIWDATGFDFTEFITAGIDTFLLEVKMYNGTSYDIIWQGYYIYNTDVTLNEITPIKFTLQFSDVLQMKINRFYNFPSSDTRLVRYYPSEKISLLELIMKCCYFSYTTNSVIIEDPMIPDEDVLPGFNRYKNGTSSYVNVSLPLSEMYVQKNAFLDDLGKYKTLFDAISGVCYQFGLTAYFKGNKLHVKPYDSLVNSLTRYVTEYTIDSYNSTTDVTTYSLVSSYHETDDVTQLNSPDFLNIGRDQSIRFNYPVSSIILTNEASKNYNTPNYTMSSLSEVYISGTTTKDSIVNSWYSKIGGKLVERLAGGDDQQNPLNIRPFSPYALYKSGDTLEHFGTRVTATGNTPGFDSTSYIDSEEFSVSSGDVFAFSYSAFLDGRFKNLSSGDQSAYRPNPVVSIVLLANNSNGDETEFFYDYSTNKFSSYLTPPSTGIVPLILTSNYNGTDADWIHCDIRGTLDIPGNAKLKVRQYAPYRASATAGATDIMQLFVEYCNLQTFKSSPISSLPSRQNIKVFYNDLINSDTSIDLNSNLFMMDATKYTPTVSPSSTAPKNKNPIYVTSCLGNTVFDKFNTPASFITAYYDNPSCIGISYTTLKNKLKESPTGLLKNVGLNNTTLEGTYKSTAKYFIGTKFNYGIIGYYDVTFAMLDYTIDFKNSTYNGILYSSKFTDDTDLTISATTLIS